MILLNEDMVECTSLPSTELFNQLDSFDSEEDFDVSFIPHIWWGPLEDVHVVKTLWSERYDGELATCVIIHFNWAEWSFEMTIMLYTQHSCPCCKCVTSDGLEERIREDIETICWGLDL